MCSCERIRVQSVFDKPLVRCLGIAALSLLNSELKFSLVHAFIYAD